MMNDAVAKGRDKMTLINDLLCLRDCRGNKPPSAMEKVIVATLLCQADDDLICTLPERDICGVLDITEKTLRKFVRVACERGLLRVTKNNRFGQKQYNLQPLLLYLARSTEQPLRSRQRPCVYLLLDEARRLLKIGYSEDLARRVAQVVAAIGNTKIRVLATITAGRDVERDLIARFAHERIAGEWFHYRSEIVSAFMDIRGALGSED